MSPKGTKYEDFNANRSGNEKILLVEGPDDMHVLKHLFRVLNAACGNDLRILDCGGYEEVLKALGSERATPTRAAIVGAVIDADERTHASLLESIRNRIETGEDYSWSDEWPTDGLFLEPNPAMRAFGLPRFGVWCMPDNQTEGIFEDLLNRAIPHLSQQFIEETLTTALSLKHASFTEIQRPKATLRTYMAWQDPTWSKYGEALGAKLLNADSLRPHFQPLIDWANCLFAK